MYVKPEPLSAKNYTILNDYWRGGIYFMEIRQPLPEHKICDECEVSEDE